MFHLVVPGCDIAPTPDRETGTSGTTLETDKPSLAQVVNKRTTFVTAGRTSTCANSFSSRYFFLRGSARHQEPSNT